MIVLLGLSVAFVAIFYLYFSWNNDYWMKHGVPHNKPTFFFGNLKEVIQQKKHIGIAYEELYKKYSNAAYVGFYKFINPTIIIRDLDLIKAVLVKDWTHFAKNDMQLNPKKDKLMLINPFFLTGEEWKKKRTQWSSLMTPSKLKTLYPIMMEKAEGMVAYLNNHIKEMPQEPLEVKELGSKYLTDVAVSGILGLKVKTSFEDNDNIFKKIALGLFSGTFFDGICMLLSMILPSVHSVLGIGVTPNWIKAECHDIAKNIVALRQQQGVTKHEFLDISHFMKDGEVDYAEISGRVLSFLTETIETSSGVVSFALYELAANPQIQSQLRRELEELTAADDGKMSLDNLLGNKYLDMIINESMRMYPPGQFVFKLCTKDYTLPPAVEGGTPYTIPEGMSVIISVYGLHHDPTMFKNPDQFDPERFRNEEDIKKFSFLPFGEGPRACIGIRLALLNIKVAIATLVRNFELRVSPKTSPRPIPLDPAALITKALGDLWITFHHIRK